MIKVMITERNNLNENLLKKEFEIVNNPEEADFLISQSTVMFPQYMHKTFYVAVEPPRTDHRIWAYGQFDRFHTVITHNPDISKENQFPFTKDDCPQFYPTRADPYDFITREDTTINNRGVFYAGMINIFENGPNAHGGINITPLRKVLGNYFKNTEPFNKDTIVIGIGWDRQQTKVADWRKDKINRIVDSKCDFVLALENTIFPNYLYEKIWDGFISDRVTMYLGDPRIESHIPLNCFIDLRKYFNVDTGEFNLDALGNYLKEMSQEEYNEIISHAREFRKTAEGKYKHYMDELTKFIIERIKNGKRETNN